MLDTYGFNNKRYEKIRRTPGVVRAPKIVELSSKNKRILDVGCGFGDVGAMLIDRSNEVYGVDISKQCVKVCASKGMITKLCDVEKDAIPFKEKFDVIIAGEIIEHVYDTEGFLKKLRSSLKKDGELIITTPNVAALGRRLLLLIGKNPHLEPSLDIKYAGHVRYFTKNLLKELLEGAGFRVVHFSSGVINFNSSGTIKSETLANLYPTFGNTLIFKCKKS